MNKKQTRLEKKKEKKNCHISKGLTDPLLATNFSFKTYSIYFGDSTMYNTTREDILTEIKKYTVMNQYGYYKASFEEESNAITYIKRLVSADPTVRYIILETMKEVGATCPDVEINDFKATALLTQE